MGEVETGNKPTEVEREKRRREVVHARNSGDGKGIRGTSVHSPLTGRTVYCTLMRALVSGPPLVLLDEEWSGMDEYMIDAMWEMLD